MLKQLVTAPSLAAIRMQKGYSQSRLADLIGVNQSQLSHIESGRRSVSIDVACNLAKVLGGIDLHYGGVTYRLEPKVESREGQ